MSRHRIVKKLDLDEELADDYGYDDDPYENLEANDKESLESSYSAILDVLGPPDSANNPFSEREIKDSLWDAYFDSEAVLDDLIQEAEKRKKRKQGTDSHEDDTPMDDDMSRLSLGSERPSRGGHLRGRARGIAGLNPAGGRGGGGRAGLAKRNLASLAPGGLPGVPVSAERPFGPQAGDVGTRSPRNQTPAETSATSSAKPMSKLALLAQKRRAVAAGSSTAGAGNEAAARLSPSKRGPEAHQPEVSAGGPSSEQASLDASQTPPRPSKLMALAQGRKAQAQGQINVSPLPGIAQPSAPPQEPAAPPAKPLSKLQQRALAAKKEREERERLAKQQAEQTGSGSLNGNAMDADADGGGSGAAADDIGSGQTLPSGASELSLFPRLPTHVATSQVGTLLKGSRQDVPGNVDIAWLQPDESVRIAFAEPSPDDKVLNARKGTASAAKKSGTSTPQGAPAKVATKAKNAASASGLHVSSSSKGSSAAASKVGTPREEKSAAPLDGASLSKLRQEVEGLGLTSSDSGASQDVTSKPASHEKILEEWRQREVSDGGKKEISVVVVGHVDAGKSTLMGRVLHEVGMMTDREHNANERASSKLGKGSFAYAWALDASEEERERGVTISTAHAHFTLPHRAYTVLDAPGHRDFVPSMISGAAQADVALLVIDATKGAFEAGFGPRGQTREHAVLIRALGVRDLVVVVNKMDTVDYEEERYEEIVSQLKPFLNSTGFDSSRVKFIPCGAAAGENISQRTPNGSLSQWYKDQALLEFLDTLNPPTREVTGPLRLPLTNVFRGQTAISSGVAAAGRVISGLIAVGDRIRVVPGDESATIRAIEQDGESVPWAVAGASVTAYLAGIDEIHLAIGSVLCPPSEPVALSTNLLVQLLVFDPTYPILTGSSASLHHHSLDVPCTITELVSSIDKTGSNSSGSKRKPRVLGKGATAMVRISITSPGLPIEVNRKDLSRVLLRMHGETVAAGNVTECS